MINHREIKKPKYLPERVPLTPFLTKNKEDIDSKPSLFSARKMHADIEEKKILERNKIRSKFIS